MAEGADQFASDLFDRATHDSKAAMAGKQSQMIKAGADRGTQGAIALAKIYAQFGHDALIEALASLERKELARGKSWLTSISAIEAALNSYFDKGGDLVASKMSKDLNSARAVAQRHLETERAILLNHVSHFRNGWASSPGKGWHERHPVYYGLAIVMLGLGLGPVIDHFVERLLKPEGPKAQQTATRTLKGAKPVSSKAEPDSKPQ